MKRIALLALVLTCAAARADAPCKQLETPKPAATKEEVRRLMLQMGADKVAAQMIEQMFEALRPALANVPKETQDRFFAEFKKEATADTLMSLSIPAYASRFSQEEILQLRALYSTPVGKKFIAETPAITAETMTAGRKWGETAGRRAMERATQK